MDYNYTLSSATDSKAKMYKYQGQERNEDGGLNWDSCKWRNYDYAIGRFFGIDPLAEGYIYNCPYAFAENKVVANFELEGLEAKLAIYGEGAGTNYSESDKTSFRNRATNFETFLNHNRIPT